MPQKRERIYIVGLNKDCFSEQQFIQLKNTITEQYEKQKLKPLPKFIDILEKQVDSKFTLSDKLWIFFKSHAQKHNDKGNGFGFGIINRLCAF